MSSWGDITSKNLVWGSRAWQGGATGTGGGEQGQEGRPGGRQTRSPGRRSSWQDDLPTACRESQDEDNGQKSHLDGRKEELGGLGLQLVQNLGHCSTLKTA